MIPIEFDRLVDDWPDAGVYQLWVDVADGVRATVGRLGRLRFPAGIYVYTRRASRGLRARVRRHLGGAARRHWHIDFLLAKPEVAVVRVALASPDADEECSVNQAVGLTGDCVVPGFGASDCRAGCPTHLWCCRSVSKGERTWPVRKQSR
ncbi:MAG: GIY-YIG nuclease family protein [Armatimonadetes bacterium]|nr:GIY-YIG nuclease family protein [Armatimonadota bacterium]